MREFSCPHLNECSGCVPMAKALSAQQDLKLQNFISKTKSNHIFEEDLKVIVHNLGDGFLRTRMELTWQNSHWGFWSKEKNDLLAIGECHQLEPRLNDFYQNFKKLEWPLKKASVRLRLSPSGKFGIWLDLANEDVKMLFDERLLLHKCLQMAEVEIGQRRKKLVFEVERFRLKDPVYDNWISTFVSGKEIPLASLIGGFSQTGPIATKVIAGLIESLLDKTQAQYILEFGSGFGTLTLPSAGKNRRKVLALEVDERSVEALHLSLKQNQINSVEVLRGDFQRKNFVDERLQKVDCFLVNPPRSGVQNLLQDIPGNVKSLIYMSCFEESFFKDSENLKAQGFILNEAHLIDQFPQSPHTEWMSLWIR